MSKSERFIQVGGILAGLGGALTVGFFLLTYEEGGDFWTWPGWLGVITMGTGLIFVVAGFVTRTSTPSADSQTQRAGRRSRNYQAGRDINFGGSERD